MTCRDIDELTSSAPGNPVRTPEAIEHLVKCQDCRALLSVVYERGQPSAPPEAQLNRIQARITQNLRSVRSLTPSRFFLFACAIVFFFIVAIGVMPFGMNGWRALSMPQKIAIFATLAASAVLLTVSTGGQMVPGSKYALAPAALPIEILTVLVIERAHILDPGGVSVLAASAARRDPLSETHRRGHRWIGRFDRPYCTGNQLSEFERISHHRLALGRGPVQLGGRRVTRRCGGIHRTMARPEGVLELAALLGERLRFAADVGPA
jgi:hypothetical protein